MKGKCCANKELRQVGCGSGPGKQSQFGQGAGIRGRVQRPAPRRPNSGPVVQTNPIPGLAGWGEARGTEGEGSLRKTNPVSCRGPVAWGRRGVRRGANAQNKPNFPSSKTNGKCVEEKDLWLFVPTRGLGKTNPISRRGRVGRGPRGVGRGGKCAKQTQSPPRRVAGANRSHRTKPIWPAEIPQHSNPISITRHRLDAPLRATKPVSIRRGGRLLRCASQ